VGDGFVPLHEFDFFCHNKGSLVCLTMLEGFTLLFPLVDCDARIRAD